MWFIRILLFLGLLALAISASKKKGSKHRRIDIEEDCPLCDYVYSEDDHFAWFIMSVEDRQGYTTYFLNVTSQKWLDESWATPSVWWHYVAVHVPDNPRPGLDDVGFLYLSYRSNDNSPPNTDSDHVRQTGEMCERLHMTTAVIQQIPNQPLVFTEDPQERNRWEDDLIAWTWDYFIEAYNDPEREENPDHLARNPMCKGGVAAMDAMSELLVSLDRDPVYRIFLAGESKRGWTTWITGAIDNRVVGMAPVVLTCLNMTENFYHYYQSFGGWPYYFWDYWSKGLMAHLDTDGMRAMEDVIDPYAYRTWMTMPKLVISGSSDEFFLLDDTHYFWDELPEEKYFWLMDNTGHSIGSSPHNQEYWELLGDFAHSVFTDPDGESRPNLVWERTTDNDAGTGTIRVISDIEPERAEGYWADSIVPDRRDWRTRMLNYSIASLPPNGSLPAEVMSEIVFEPVVLDHREDVIEFTVSFPEEGYRAFFITLWYRIPPQGDLIFSTETHIVPDNFPHAQCEGPEECRGWLW